MPELKQRSEINLECKSTRNRESLQKFKALASRYSIARLDYIMIYLGEHSKSKIDNLLRKSERKICVNPYSKL